MRERNRLDLVRAMPLARRRRLLALCVLAWAATGTVLAGGVSEAERLRGELLATLSMADREYRVAIAAVVDERADPAEAAAMGAYAEILRDALLEVPRRYLSEEERSALRRGQIDRERASVATSRDQRLEVLERGSIERPEEESPAKRRSDDTLLELDRTLSLLETITPSEVRLPPTIPILILDHDPLFRRRAPDPAVLAQQLEADLLLTLQVEELGDLRMITVYGYFRALSKTELLGRVIAEPEFLPAHFEEQLPAVLTILSAMELATISVRVTDEEGGIDRDARIRLDGRLIGVGEAREGYLSAGSYTLSASRSDGRMVSQQITIDAGEQYTVALSLPPIDREPVTLLSRPAGAAVYEGALWRGVTPLALPRPSDQVEYRIVQEGYYESRLSLTADAPPVIRQSLIGTDYDWEAQVEADRRRFYRSFGAFAVSLAGPILLNGVYQNLGGLYPGGTARTDLSLEEQERLQTQADALFYTYYGSLALSSGLFGHMIWRLVQYVQTSGGFHRR